MDVGAEASGGISKVDLTFKLETKAQNTATLLPPQGSTLMHTRMSRSTLVTRFIKIQYSKTPSHTGILKDEQGNSLMVQPTQGWNLCLLPWQADSLPLSHLGSLVGISSRLSLLLLSYCIFLLFRLGPVMT